MMSVRLERLASNQVVFRELNERLLELLDASPGPTEFLCECSDPECTDPVLLTILEYERIRSRSNQFVVIQEGKGVVSKQPVPVMTGAGTPVAPGL